MKKIVKLVCVLSVFVFAQTVCAQKAGKREVDKDLKQIQKNQQFDWEAMVLSKDTTIKMDSVHLSGTWKAYNGLFKFEDRINSMNLFKPFVIAMNGSQINRSENSSPLPFEISGNKLVVKSDQQEEGFINMLTNKMLVISWKNGSNYTRYYYERSE